MPKLPLSRLQAVLCLAFALLGVALRAQTPPPNIVYINADDLGWTDLAIQGSEYYETPNIDRLAREGMRFTHAYAPASNCSPSRASCLLGQYMPRHGRYTNGSSERGRPEDRKLIPVENFNGFPEETVTIAEVLQEAGYVTAHMGKWHLDSDPVPHGFDVNIAGGKYGSPRSFGYHSPYRLPNCVQEEEGEYLTDRLGLEAVRFIAQHRDKPFFLYFATYSPHTPIQAKADLEAYFRGKPGTEAHSNPGYAAMIRSVDKNVGRIVETIDALGLAENTLILFTSDNGAVWPISKQWPLRAGKGSYYEGGIRVPLIVRQPNTVPAGIVDETPVIGVDFFPTFLDAAGIRAPEGWALDGVSLMPVFRQRGELPERALFWHFPIYLQPYVVKGAVETRDPAFRTRPGSAVRLGNWKLLEYFEDHSLELYDLSSDPGEKHDLSEAMPGKTLALKALLDDWREDLEAPIPTEPNPRYRAAGSAASE